MGLDFLTFLVKIIPFTIIKMDIIEDNIRRVTQLMDIDAFTFAGMFVIWLMLRSWLGMFIKATPPFRNT